jgi:hypothetical protein
VSGLRKKASRLLVQWSGGRGRPPLSDNPSNRGDAEMKIVIKKVESIKATRCHLDPDAGGA